MNTYYVIDDDGKRHNLTEGQLKEVKQHYKNGHLYIVIGDTVYFVHKEYKPDPIGNTYTAKNGFKFTLYNIDEAKKKPERKAIVKNYFYEDTINLIYGQSGHGKTWWALYEAVCFVLGKKFLDLDIQPMDGDLPYKVLYISLEMTARDLADRVHELCVDLKPQEKKQVMENLTIVSFEDNGNMIAGSTGFLPALEDLCNDESPFNIIYIDSFTDYIVGYDERSEDHMRRVITALRTFTVNNHVSFRIIHHGTKTLADGSGGSMAGIHTIRDLVDCVVSIKQKQDELTITNDQKEDPSAKNRYNKPITMIAGIKSDGESYFSFYRKAEEEKIDSITMMKNILSAVEDQQGITAGELKDRVRKIDIRLRDSMIGNQLIMNVEKSERGKDTKRFYTVDYYNNHREKIDNGITGTKRGQNGDKTVFNNNGITGTNGI